MTIAPATESDTCERNRSPDIGLGYDRYHG